MKSSGILAGVVALMLLAGCGEDAPEKVDPSTATKWLSDNGYTVNKEGLEKAIDKFDERAIRYLFTLDPGGKKYAGEVFVISVGSCGVYGWYFTGEECIKVAKIFLDAGMPLDYRIPLRGGFTWRGQNYATVLDALEMPYEFLIAAPFTRDLLSPKQFDVFDELVKARPAVLEYLKDRQN